MWNNKNIQKDKIENTQPNNAPLVKYGHCKKSTSLNKKPSNTIKHAYIRYTSQEKWIALYK